PNPTFVWNIVHPLLKWKTVLDTAQFADHCGAKLLGTAEMATLGVCATLVSLYLAKECRKKKNEFLLSPRTRDAVERSPNMRATLVRKPLPPAPTPSGDKPPAPPSGNFDNVAQQLKKASEAPGCILS